MREERSGPVAAAWFGGMLATGLADVTDDLSALDAGGRWAVVIEYEGAAVCARFRDWRPADPASVAGRWAGPGLGSYSTSMSRDRYVDAVQDVRSAIAAGTVYQANICRILRAPLPDPAAADPAALAVLLADGNQAPHQGFLRLPDKGVGIATASPELFLRRAGDEVWSGPIKGTGVTADDMTDKDRAENIMIVDLVRNDLSQVAVPGSVDVPDLLSIEEHPGLFHLVSRVRCRLRPGTTWPDLIAATFPPGSVSGAPKHTAVQVIERNEPTPRGPYCGAIGWVDADTREAELAVGIRTFWIERGDLCFGTGAGITWGSEPGAEWDETALKARRLVQLAGGRWP